MKRPLFLAFGAVFAASCIGAHAQNSSTSPILGYYTAAVPAGNSTMVVGLVKKKDHQGGMDNVSFDVTAGQTTVVENDRDMTTVPLDRHYLEIIDGMWEGLILNIVPGSATANSFVVDDDLTRFTGLALDSGFAIREHATLGDLWPDGGGFGINSDFVVTFDNTGASTIHQWNGSNWQELGGVVDATNTVVNPGQGMLIIAAGAREILVGKNGVSNVKENRTLIPYIGGSAVNLVGAINPVVGKNHLLGDMGFATSIQASDFVIPFSNDGALNALGFYRTDGTAMNEGGIDASNVEVGVGTAVFMLATVDGGYYASPALDASLLVDPNP